MCRVGSLTLLLAEFWLLFPSACCSQLEAGVNKAIPARGPDAVHNTFCLRAGLARH